MKKEYKGLKKLRRITAKAPIYHCDNCGCKRYSVCSCKKMEKK